jgi:hypothetical protein
MKEIPTPNEGPDEVDEQYRRLSDRESSGPSEAVRRAVLRHAAELAAQSRTQENAPARGTPVAKRTPWRIATYGGLAAAAALAGLLVIPHFLMPSTEPAARLPPPSSYVPDTGASTAAPALPPARQADAPRAEEMPGLARNSTARGSAPASQPQTLAPLAAGSPPRLFSLSRAASPADPAAALREAAQRGDVPTLRRLVAADLNINARDAGGRTALMIAVLHGQKEAVNVLLAAGADPNAADATGTKPLQAALARAHSAIAAALEQSGAR